MTQLTQGKIYKLLGLESPHVFGLVAARHNLSKETEAVKGPATTLREALRQTGRSTRVVIAALTVLSEGTPIYFTAESEAMVQWLTDKARHYAQILGLDVTKVLPCAPDAAGHLAAVGFVDHP